MVVRFLAEAITFTRLAIRGKFSGGGHSRREGRLHGNEIGAVRGKSISIFTGSDSGKAATGGVLPHSYQGRCRRSLEFLPREQGFPHYGVQETRWRDATRMLSGCRSLENPVAIRRGPHYNRRRMFPAARPMPRRKLRPVGGLSS